MRNLHEEGILNLLFFFELSGLLLQPEGHLLDHFLEFRSPIFFFHEFIKPFFILFLIHFGIGIFVS